MGKLVGRVLLVFLLAPLSLQVDAQLFPSRATTGVFADGFVLQDRFPVLHYASNSSIAIPLNGFFAANETYFVITVLEDKIVASTGYCSILVFTCLQTQTVGSHTFCSDVSAPRMIGPGVCGPNQPELRFGRTFSVLGEVLVAAVEERRVDLYNLSSPGLDQFANVSLPIQNPDKTWITSLLARPSADPRMPVLDGTVASKTINGFEVLWPLYCANFSYCEPPEEPLDKSISIGSAGYEVSTFSVSNRVVYYIHPRSGQGTTISFLLKYSGQLTLTTYSPQPSWFTARCDLFQTAFRLFNITGRFDDECIFVVTKRESSHIFPEEWALTALRFGHGSDEYDTIDIFPNNFGLRDQYSPLHRNPTNLWTAVSDRFLVVYFAPTVINPNAINIFPRAPVGYMPCYFSAFYDSSCDRNTYIAPCPRGKVKKVSDAFGCIFCEPGTLPNEAQTDCIKCQKGQRCLPGFVQAIVPSLFGDQTNTPPFAPSEALESKEYLMRTIVPKGGPKETSWVFALAVSAVALAGLLIIASYFTIGCNKCKRLRYPLKVIDLFYVVDQPSYSNPTSRPIRRLYTPVGGILTVLSILLALIVLISTAYQLANYKPVELTAEAMRQAHPARTFQPTTDPTNSYRTANTLSADEGVGSEVLQGQLASLKADSAFIFEFRFLNFTPAGPLCSRDYFFIQFEAIKQEKLQVDFFSLPELQQCLFRISLEPGATVEPKLVVKNSMSFLFTSLQLNVTIVGSDPIMPTFYQTTMFGTDDGIISGVGSAVFRTSPVIRKTTHDVFLQNSTTTLYSPITLVLAHLPCTTVEGYSTDDVTRTISVAIEAKSTGLLIEETPALDFSTAVVTMVVLGVSFFNLISAIAKKEKKLHHCIRTRCRRKKAKAERTADTSEPLLDPFHDE